jgi:2-keto-4-pentenoate hydratase/2-oxohepta-3-ene-1,7-dioic acid hydratase in catechol pathway
MKWMSVQTQDGLRVGYVTEEGALQLVDAQRMQDIVEGAAWRDVGEAVPLASVKPALPLVPRNIICVGANYRDHCIETGLAIPEKPVIFAKFSNTLAADGDALTWPEGFTEKVDWEAELGVVIGRRAKGVSEADALSHVFGYVAANDVSARDVQLGEAQWVRGKSLDGFCPLAPMLVTRDEIADVQSLDIRCLVNGEAVQSSNTREMIFSVAYLVAYISRAITLEPGDLILTGTPAGVGLGLKPPRFLKRGDVVSVEIQGLGSVTNPVEGAVARG